MSRELIFKTDSKHILEYGEVTGEIVRCKDCKYWRTDENVRCRLLPYADANDFCSYGERIEE